MKTYLIGYETNYGAGAFVVNANDAEEAKRFAVADGAWEAYIEISEIDTNKIGVVGSVFPSGG